MPDKTTKNPDTNILTAHREIFTEMILHPEDYVLISCFYNGQPSVAIARVVPEGDDVVIYPLFLTVPKDAIITGHDGEEAQGFDWQGFNDEQCDCDACDCEEDDDED
jgi:hypothetical protein